MKRSEIRKQDAIWSRTLRAKTPQCLMCGATKNLQAAHIISRTVREKRWDLTNGYVLCYRCHMHVVHHDAMTTMNWILTKQPWIYEYWKEWYENNQKDT